MRRLGVIGTALVAIGCGGGVEKTDVDAVTKRMVELERRLAAVEQSVEPVEKIGVDLASLDRRLTSIESGLRDLGTRSTPPPAAPAAPPGPPRATGPGTSSAPPRRAERGMPGGPAEWGPTNRAERAERRTALRSLSEEFRQKLRQLNAERGGQPPTPEQQQQIQDTLQWYRDQRSALMRGEPRTDQ